MAVYLHISCRVCHDLHPHIKGPIALYYVADGTNWLILCCSIRIGLGDIETKCHERKITFLLVHLSCFKV